MSIMGSDLDLSWLLLLLGAAVLVGVLLFNLREYRQLRRGLRTSAPASAQRREPEPVLSPEPDIPARGALDDVPPFHESLMASVRLLDYPLDVLPDAFLQAASDLVRVGNKSAAVRVVRDDTDRIQSVYAGLVLANRLGPLSLPDYEAWVELTRNLRQLLRADGADALGFEGEDVLASFAELHAHSRDAERRIAALDGQMVLHILAAPPTDAQLAGWAESLGLQPRADRRYSRLDRHGQVQYSLAPGDQGRALSCMLDLPRVERPEDAYRSMVEDLQSAVEWLDGRLVDESNRRLLDEDLALIERQVAARADELRAAGLEPGSWIARAVYV